MRRTKGSTLSAAELHTKLSTTDVTHMSHDLKGWRRKEPAKRSRSSETKFSLLKNGKIEIGKKHADQLAKAFNVHPAIILSTEYEQRRIQAAAGWLQSNCHV